MRRAGGSAGPDQAVGQLDGRRRPPRRGRAPVRCGARGGHGTVPGAGTGHSGRQGFAVDAGAVDDRWRSAEVGVAGLAGRHRVRAGGRRAPATDAAAAARCRDGAVADRPGRRPPAPGRFGAGADAIPVTAATARCPRSAAKCPTWTIPQRLRGLFELVRDAREAGLLLAYHDRSDGGAFAALCEMAFASHMGLDIVLDGWGDGRADDVFRTLFNEELGAVVQVAGRRPRRLRRHGRAPWPDRMRAAHRTADHRAGVIRVSQEDSVLVEWRWEDLFDAWWSTSHAMQRLRDNPECADQERARDASLRCAADGAGADLRSGRGRRRSRSSARARGRRVAILREQGVNGQIEMAAAFDRAGFDAFDVHMSDLVAGRVDLGDFKGFVACGGFSYGDVLGAGRGWATSILERSALRDAFAAFFARGDTFALGVCNGCQMMASCATSFPVRSTGRRSCATAASSSKRAWRCWKSSSRRRCSCAAWPGRASRWRWRTAKAAPRSRTAVDQAAARVSLRYVDWRRQRGRPVPGQPERFARRHRRPDQPRRPRHHPDAASGTHPAQRQSQLGAGRLAGRFAVAADVPQCAGVAGLISETKKPAFAGFFVDAIVLGQVCTYLYSTAQYGKSR